MNGFVLRLILPALVVIGMLLPLAPPAWAQSTEYWATYDQYDALKKAGKYREAIPHALRLLELGKCEFGTEHKTYAILINNLSGLYKDQGRDEEAEPLFRRSLVIKEKALGTDHVARHPFATTRYPNETARRQKNPQP